MPTWGVFVNEYEQGGGPLIDIGTHALDLTLWTMNNYKPKYCVGTTYHKLNKDTDQGNAWGNWDPEKFTVEDSAFGFIVMENGATIILESAWALNTLDVREAVTTICGTKAGGDTNGSTVRINGIRQNRQYVLEPNFNAGGAAFNDAAAGEGCADREERLWVEAIRGASGFLIEVMPALFIPAGVGLMASFGVLRPMLVPIAVIMAVSTVVVMGVSGRVTQGVIRRERRGEEEPHA